MENIVTLVTELGSFGLLLGLAGFIIYSYIKNQPAVKNANNDDIKEMFKESCRDFEELYKDIISDLNGEEIQFNDYYLFFENGKQVFPQYIDALKKIENEEIKEYIDSLINVFTNLNKISKSFPSQQDMVKWVLI